MMLKKLVIQGYKSCDDMVIEPNRGLTVLIGANGAGKTNILTAINTLYSPESILFPLHNRQEGNNNFISGPCITADFFTNLHDYY
jgi:predicted ATP-dependent endonuclease of OLD family